MQVNKCSDDQKQALVALGANLSLGSRTPSQTVAAAIDMLAARSGAAVTRSRLWQTPAYPAGSGPPFVNAAVAFDWPGAAEALLDLLHEVEDAFGRRRTRRWEARKMDLDLIALGDRVLPDVTEFLRWHHLAPQEAATMTPDHLILPHPRMTERGFVLAPLSEVAPDWRHPVHGKSVVEMLAKLPQDELDAMVPLDQRAHVTPTRS